MCSSTWIFSSWYSRSVLSVLSRSVWSRASCSPWVRRKMWVFWASICCCSFSCCGSETAVTSPSGPCDFAACTSHNWFVPAIAPAEPCSKVWQLLKTGWFSYMGNWLAATAWIMKQHSSWTANTVKINRMYSCMQTFKDVTKYCILTKWGKYKVNTNLKSY